MEERMKRQLCETMAENLPVLRNKAGLTQENLARIIGLTRQTIVAVETGKRMLPWNTFLSLILIFSKNNQTERLLEFFGIYTKELESYITF